MGRFCVNCGHPIGAPVPLDDPAADLVPPPPARAQRRWNPAEDLLPFEDTSHVPSRGGLSGRAMLGWVVGAVLLVGLVFVLLRVFGVDGDAGTATAPASGQESAQESAGAEDPAAEDPAAETSETVGRAGNAMRGATLDVPTTAPETQDLDGSLVGYQAAQMRDGVPASTWRMAGDGTGSVITITLRRPTVVSRVGLINGYAKQVSGVDWYPSNRRILAVEWGFDDGSTLEQSLDERPILQRMEVPAVLTSQVTLTLTSVTPPGPGTLGRDYTAISEVAIIGRQAG